MAASDSQALTRAHHPPSNLSKSTRLNVPQFVQKLYEMVNEPSNTDLIRWSDAGDSFVVLDHERIAREVLGRWFKHQNFQSFVRQLNMYGFHKIPSLQQGVLRSDSDTEAWNFEHPYFRQGQPDLLCLIERKKQASQQPTAAEQTSTDVQPPASPGATSSGAVLDLNSIVTGIQAIKRHQQTISADLNELKSSNQSLWQEAIAARERHSKQQDMINRILKFLASVFGRHEGQPGQDHHHDGVSPSPPLARTQRLMISGPDRHKKGVEVVEVDDDERPHTPTSTKSDDGGGPSPFAHIDSTSAVSRSTSPQFTPISTAPSTRDSYFDPTSSPWLSVNGFPPSNQPPTIATPSDPPQTQLELHHPQSTPPNGPFALSSQAQPSTSYHPQDAVLQAAYQHLMHSPAQMQRFLEAIAQNSAANADASQNAMQAYSAASPFAPVPSFDYPNFNPDLSALLPKVDDAAPSVQPLYESTDRLSKIYQSKNEIDADVDLIHANINRLIENMGLDAVALTAPPLAPASPQRQPPTATAAAEPPPVDPPADFDYFDFLNPFAGTDAPSAADAPDDDGGNSSMTAFMDDVAADPERAKEAASKSRKRRSDAADLDLRPPTPPTTRSKKAKA